MKNFQAAPQYARALFRLAQGQKKSADILSELEGVEALLEKHTKLRDLLELPSFETSKKFALIDEFFSKTLQRLTVNFLKHVIRKNHIDALAEILFYYKVQLKESKHIAEAKVMSARPLTKEVSNQLAKKLEQITSLKIELQNEVNPALIGGAIIQIKNQVMDFSIKRQLEELKEALIC